jgi:hypothetical protein
VAVRRISRAAAKSTAEPRQVSAGEIVSAKARLGGARIVHIHTESSCAGGASGNGRHAGPRARRSHQGVNRSGARCVERRWTETYTAVTPPVHRLYPPIHRYVATGLALGTMRARGQRTVAFACSPGSSGRGEAAITLYLNGARPLRARPRINASEHG